MTEGVLGLHRCKVCGTGWLLWPDAGHGAIWNLLDKYQRPGACCDNEAMGDQIEHLRDIPLAAAPVPCAASPADTEKVESYRVEPDADGGEWHILTFANGHQRHILTRHPLVEVEPETH